MSDKAAAPAEGAPAKSGSMGTVVVSLLCVLNLGGTGFVAFKVIKLPKAQAAEAHGEEAGPEKLPPPTVPLEPFVVNLNEPGSSRYLKATLELELEDAKAADELTKNKRAVRDDLLRYLSSLSVADTLGEVNKSKIQEQVVTRVDKQLGGKEKVSRLFFTEFMVQ